jgi:hypothetical protein
MVFSVGEINLRNDEDEAIFPERGIESTKGGQPLVTSRSLTPVLTHRVWARKEMWENPIRIGAAGDLQTD